MSYKVERCWRRLATNTSRNLPVSLRVLLVLAWGPSVIDSRSDWLQLKRTPFIIGSSGRPSSAFAIVPDLKPLRIN